MNYHSIIKQPLKTERTTSMRQYNRYVFVVDPTSNKIEIKRAVENIFNVNVVGVRTMNVRGKQRRMGLRSGKQPDWKKAIVTLKDGDKIAILDE